MGGKRKVYLQTGRFLSLRGPIGDEAISFSNEDCFAEFTLLAPVPPPRRGQAGTGELGRRARNNLVP